MKELYTCKNIKLRSGISLIETLIVLVILAVLAGTGFVYYSDYTSQAEVSAASVNVNMVREAISRYFKDNMSYPKSLNSLAPYMQQDPETVLVSRLRQSDSGVKIEVYGARDEAPELVRKYLFQATDTQDLKWHIYDENFLQKEIEFNNIRIRYLDYYIE